MTGRLDALLCGVPRLPPPAVCAFVGWGVHQRHCFLCGTDRPPRDPFRWARSVAARARRCLGPQVYYPWVKGMGNIVQNMLNEFGASWVVSAADSSSYCVSNADELTATFSWGDSMRSTIVRGSPYVTAEYKNAEVCALLRVLRARLDYC